MFGYVVPQQPELKVKELEYYKSVYCGVCKQMGKKYGFLTRMFLNYDFVFLALVLQCANNGKTSITKARCVCNPAKKVLYCENSAIDYSAGVSVLLVYHKLIDDIKDSGFLKRLFSRVLKLLLTPGYKKARRELSKEDASIEKSMSDLDALEKQQSPNMDLVASTFFDMLSFVAQQGTNDPIKKRITFEMGKNIGRWIYLIDAFHDIKDDVKDHSYNPLIYRYGLKPDENIDDFILRIRDEVDFTLAQCLYNLCGAYELLENDDPVLRNIVYLGLRQKQYQIIYPQQYQKELDALGKILEE